MPERLVGTCYTCGRSFASCAECVNTIKIDPVTLLPPDVGPDRTPIKPDPEALARCVTELICDACVDTANTLGANPPLVPWETRHAQTHRWADA